MSEVDLLRATMKALEDAAVPDNLREVAFSAVFNLLATGGRDDVAPRPAVLTASATPVTPGPAAALAQRLNVSIEDIDAAFFFGADGVELVVPASRLSPVKSRATEQIALLVVAARQGAGIDEDGWSTVEPIRIACENYKRYDPKNFATTIKDLDNLFTVRGTGRDRKIRMTAPAWQRAGEVLEQLTKG